MKEGLPSGCYANHARSNWNPAAEQSHPLQICHLVADSANAALMAYMPGGGGT